MFMEEYYRRRAREYDEMYHLRDPAWQEELNKIACALRGALKGKRVLEIACGTGYWTQILSETAQTIVATDITHEMLEIAKRKQYHCPVSFCKKDAYHVSFKTGAFNGGLANFWLSHIPKNRIDTFLRGFHRVLQADSQVFMTDNVYVPGIGGEFITKESDENTYKLRRLKDGSKHLVLKNYLSIDELTEIFSKHAKKFWKKDIFYGNYFWYILYEPR